MHIIPYDQVSQVKFKSNNSLRYDLNLYELDKGRHDKFLIIYSKSYEPSIVELSHSFYNCYEKTCIVWENDKIGIVAKLFPKNWELGSYKTIKLKDPQFDVIFISYHEDNAETNWQRVLEKAPWAKRVDGVEGIFNAHKAAAELSTTELFYVVDGDAYLLDDFNFVDYFPIISQSDYTHIWNSQNPINNLIYGYGGVKLFPRHIFDNASWTTLDMSTNIGQGIVMVNSISNITAFNTDEFSTWRSAFRECAKLSYGIHQNPDDKDSIDRLKGWMTLSDQPFAQYSVDATHKAQEWVSENIDNIDVLRQINDREWLRNKFNLLDYIFI